MFAAFLILLFVAAQPSQINLINNLQPCPCEHQGTCFHSLNNQTYCNCSDTYIGNQCQITGKEVNQSSNIFTVTDEFQYYYTFFNVSQVYAVRMVFCPLNFTMGATYAVSVFFQKEDGSLFNANGSENVSYQTFKVMQKNTCYLLSGLLMSPSAKLNGKSARLIMKVKQLRLTPQKVQDKSGRTPINTTMVIRIDKYQTHDTSIVQFIVIAFCSMLSISCLTFILAVYRKLSLLRRVRRYQPAEIAHNINHFDQIMPSTMYPSRSETGMMTENGQNSDECMICLLDVAQTETRMTPCGHLFHKECLDEWGRKSLTCPACRSSLADQQNINKHFHLIT